MTERQGFEAIIAEVMPEYYEQLKVGLEDAEIKHDAQGDAYCGRCGAAIRHRLMDVIDYRQVHVQYHRDLTLGVNFAQQISVEIAARVKDVIDEMDAGDLEALLARRKAADDA